MMKMMINLMPLMTPTSMTPNRMMIPPTILLHYWIPTLIRQQLETLSLWISITYFSFATFVSDAKSPQFFTLYTTPTNPHHGSPPSTLLLDSKIHPKDSSTTFLQYTMMMTFYNMHIKCLEKMNIWLAQRWKYMNQFTTTSINQSKRKRRKNRL